MNNAMFAELMASIQEMDSIVRNKAHETATISHKYAHEKEVAGIRAAKTARELQMEELRYQDLHRNTRKKKKNQV